MDKTEFLNFLDNIAACQEALEWVQEHQSNDAQEIYNSCPMLNWLDYLYNDLRIERTKEWGTIILSVYESVNESGGDFVMTTPYNISEQTVGLFEEHIDTLRLDWKIVKQAIEGVNHD